MDSDTSEQHHREHAKHNVEVFKYLRKDLTYIDWVITTAFYSALHFIEYQVFPFSIEIGDKKHTFQSIEDYKPFSGKRSKHAARKKAVKLELSDCRNDYSQLFDLSMLARYHQYQFDNPKNLNNKIDRHLSNIIDKCDS